MPIKVHRLWSQTVNNTGDEIRQANAIANLLDQSLPQVAEGNVYVKPNMKVDGARNSDLDLVIWFDTPTLVLSLRTKVRNANWPRDYDVNVQDALVVLEIKSHNTGAVIKLQNQALHLRYPDGWHDVTMQSNGQKYALKGLLDSEIGESPYVVNLI